MIPHEVMTPKYEIFLLITRESFASDCAHGFINVTAFAGLGSV